MIWIRKNIFYYKFGILEVNFYSFFMFKITLKVYCFLITLACKDNFLKLI